MPWPAGSDDAWLTRPADGTVHTNPCASSWPKHLRTRTRLPVEVPATGLTFLAGASGDEYRGARVAISTFPGVARIRRSGLPLGPTALVIMGYLVLWTGRATARLSRRPLPAWVGAGATDGASSALRRATSIGTGSAPKEAKASLLPGGRPIRVTSPSGNDARRQLRGVLRARRVRWTSNSSTSPRGRIPLHGSRTKPLQAG